MSTEANFPRKVSASSLKQLEKCTMQFYLSRYLKLPEKVWAKTIIGSLAHAIFECLYRSKHREHYDAIKKASTIYASPVVARLVKIWKNRHNISDELIADLDDMILLVFNKTNFLDEGAIQKFDSEIEFKIQLSNGGYINGFIDRMAEFKDKWVITDYKSQGQRFTKNEVEDNFQSLMYQLYVWKTYGKLAEVQYIMLRHPPTSRTPDKHLQITKPATPEQLAGFECYLEYMAELFNKFGEREAKTHFHDDEGFCERVCSYRRPFKYMIVKKKDGKGDEKRFWIDPKAEGLPYQVKDDEESQIVSHSGCIKWNQA